jgi:hypothetical protein
LRVNDERKRVVRLFKNMVKFEYRINWFICAGIITLIRVFNRIETTASRVLRCLYLVF